MEDQHILQLYLERSEQAIAETDQKYGSYCYSIAYHILASHEDAQESVSDTYLSAWNAIPPNHPLPLSPFLGKITRHLSIDRWRSATAAKRGGGQMTLALQELSECVSDGQTPETQLDRKELVGQVRKFVDGLPETHRRVFICRYWYLDTTAEIAQRFGFSESKVTSMLHRIRKKLEQQLRKEGF